MIIKCKCPECKGKGHFLYKFWSGTATDDASPKDLDPVKIQCDYCQGTGYYLTFEEEIEHAE